MFYVLQRVRFYRIFSVFVVAARFFCVLGEACFYFFVPAMFLVQRPVQDTGHLIEIWKQHTCTLARPGCSETG